MVTYTPSRLDERGALGALDSRLETQYILADVNAAAIATPGWWNRYTQET